MFGAHRFRGGRRHCRDGSPLRIRGMRSARGSRRVCDHRGAHLQRGAGEASTLSSTQDGPIRTPSRSGARLGVNSAAGAPRATVRAGTRRLSARTVAPARSLPTRVVAGSCAACCWSPTRSASVCDSVVARGGRLRPWLLLGWPLLVVLGKLNGLYGGDEKRAHHATSTTSRACSTHSRRAPSWCSCSACSSATDRLEGARALLGLLGGLVLSCGRRRVAITRRTAMYEQNTIIVGAGDVGQLIGRKIIAASRVRHQPGRIRRRATRRTAGRASATWRFSGRQRSRRDRGVDTGSSVCRRVLGRDRTRTRCRSSARSATPMSRSTSSRACSRPSGRAPTSMRSRACRCSGCHPCGSLGRRGWVKRLIDVMVASLLLVLIAPLCATSRSGSAARSPGPVLFRQ